MDSNQAKKTSIPDKNNLENNSSNGFTNNLQKTTTPVPNYVMNGSLGNSKTQTKIKSSSYMLHNGVGGWSAPLSASCRYRPNLLTRKYFNITTYNLVIATLLLWLTSWWFFTMKWSNTNPNPNANFGRRPGLPSYNGRHHPNAIALNNRKNNRENHVGGNDVDVWDEENYNINYNNNNMNLYVNNNSNKSKNLPQPFTKSLANKLLQNDVGRYAAHPRNQAPYIHNNHNPNDLIYNDNKNKDINFVDKNKPFVVNTVPASLDNVAVLRKALIETQGMKYELRKHIPIIFVGGMPRSGTTLMRAILDAHPDVRCGQETRVIPRVLFMRKSWSNSKVERNRLKEARMDDEVLDSAIGDFILTILTERSVQDTFLNHSSPPMLNVNVNINISNSKLLHGGQNYINSSNVNHYGDFGGLMGPSTAQNAYLLHNDENFNNSMNPAKYNYESNVLNLNGNQNLNHVGNEYETGNVKKGHPILFNQNGHYEEANDYVRFNGEEKSMKNYQAKNVYSDDKNGPRLNKRHVVPGNLEPPIQNANKENDMLNNDNNNNIKDFIRNLNSLKSAVKGEQNLLVNSPVDPIETTNNNYKSILLSNARKRLCNKDPFVLKTADIVHRIFPRSKFIFMIRDGRAVVHSVVTRKVTITGWDINDYKQSLGMWNNGIKQMHQICQTLGPTICKPVYYEQLVLQPNRTIRSILQFLDVPWNPRVLHHNEWVGKPDGVSLSKLERSSDQVIEPINYRGLDSWATDPNTPKDIMEKAGEIAPMLKVLNYSMGVKPYYGEAEPIYTAATPTNKEI